MSIDPSQQDIIDKIDGMVVVDAGPGTGKTYTVVRRCLHIIRRNDIAKDDVVMLTFTRNAADEMRTRLMKAIADLPPEETDEETRIRMMHTAEGMKVQTFDSYCLGIIKASPGQVSRFFGLKENLTHSASITEIDSVNKTYFRMILDRFLADHASEYGDFAVLAQESPESLFSLIERLMSRGIVPLRGTTDSGIGRWFGGNNGKDLLGDPKVLRELVGAWKPDTDFKKDFGTLTLLDGFDAAKPTPEMRGSAADDDRDCLLRMVHDIYYEFIRRSVADDRLTFGLAACFAFIILHEDKATRERIQCRYLIVDEFQDTNSNQLMICLMALKEPNLCVVGDWKQGIYGFRFVSIENITMFEERVKSLRAYLNDDIERVKYQIDDVVKLSLSTSYRSSQLIIHNAYESLYIEGSDKEKVNQKKVREIEASWKESDGRTSFCAVQCKDRDDEITETLRRIENYVDPSKGYMIRTKKEGEYRPAKYSDIAVLCRSSKMCKNVFIECKKYGIPVFLQGDLEIMSTREGKLLLAWLRYVNDDRDTWGIMPILADMKYSLGEIKWMTQYDPETGKDHIPESLKKLRNDLRGKKRRIVDLVSSVFRFYGLDNDRTQTIISVISKAHRSSLMTISEVITMIESDMENKTTYKVDGMPDENAIIIQTLHKSKGLEYPIVIIPGVNQNSFPSTKGDQSEFGFNDIAGIRCTNAVIEANGEKLIKKSWRTALVKQSIPKDYSEERRLLFVGISRASQYVTIIASNPSRFFQRYKKENTGTEYVNLTGEVVKHETERQKLVEMPTVPAVAPRRKNIGVHGIMKVEGGAEMEEADEAMSPKGRNYGTTVHKYAELVVTGIPIEEKVLEEYPEVRRVMEIVSELRKDHELDAEVDCTLPINRLNVSLRGIIDLIAVREDRVEIHDWKNDVTKMNEEEYRLQLSVYAHVAEQAYGRKAVCFIQWLVLGETEEFEPLPLEFIEKRTESVLAAYGPRTGAHSLLL